MGFKKNTDRHVNSDHRKPNNRHRVPPLAALWPVPQRQDKTHDQQAQVKVVQHDIDDADSGEIERLVFKRVREDRKRDVVAGLLKRVRRKKVDEGTKDDSPAQTN